MKGGAKYQPYPSYKSSGVEWLGDIPEAWEAIKVKLAAQFRNDKRNPSSSDIYVGLENIVPWLGEHSPSLEQDVDGLSLAFYDGDVLFGKLRPYLAKSWRANCDGVCSSEFLVMVSSCLEPKFLNYVTLTADFIHQVDGSTYGSKMPRANSEFIGQLKIPNPSPLEATKIAAFLDHETAKIDALIAKQQRLIALLEEKRQAVISHAVTKGLNPSAPLRPSGIDWIGDVPEHWDYVPLLSVSEVVDPNPSHRNPEYVEDGFPFISTQEFTGNGGIIIDTPRRVSEKTVLEQEARCNFRVGSIVFSRKGTIGATRVLPTGVRLAILDSLCVINPMPGILPEFLAKTLSAYYIAAQYGPTVNGAALPQLSVGKVRSLKLVLPPLEEQDRVVCHLNEMLGKIDALVAKAQSAITLLKERRTALISAAVTGKIDLRDWQPPEGAQAHSTQDIDQPQEALA